MGVPVDRDALNGTLAVAAGAALWGLFWVPLRALEVAGLDALLAIGLVNLAALVPALAMCRRRGALGDLATRGTWLLGAALALSGTLYFLAVLATDVVRAIFLFYLLPLWTILAARLVYGEPLVARRFAVVAVVLVGLWLLLGAGAPPRIDNAGDIAALAAGACWGTSLALLRGRSEASPHASVAATLAVAAGLSLALLALAALVTSVGALAVDTAVDTAASAGLGSLGPVVPKSAFATAGLVVLFGAVLLYPSMFGQVWGARRVPAPTAALATMAEILVATASAAWLVGTELGPVSLLGGALIVAGTGIDAAVDLHGTRRRPGALAG